MSNGKPILCAVGVGALCKVKVIASGAVAH